MRNNTCKIPLHRSSKRSTGLAHPSIKSSSQFSSSQLSSEYEQDHSFPVHYAACPDPTGGIPKTPLADGSITHVMKMGVDGHDNMDGNAVSQNMEAVQSTTNDSQGFITFDDTRYQPIVLFCAKQWRLHTLANRMQVLTKIRLQKQVFVRWRIRMAMCLAPSRQIWVAKSSDHDDWRANIRADVYYKYKLYGNIWMAWVAYVKDQKAHRFLEMRAVKLDTQTKTRRALSSWLVYHQHRKTRRSMNSAAQQKLKQFSLAQRFQAWRAYFRRRRLEMCHNELAHQVYIQRLWSHSIQRWRRRVEAGRATRYSESMADLFSRRRILKSTLFRWISQHRSSEDRATKEYLALSFRRKYECLRMRVIRLLKAAIILRKTAETRGNRLILKAKMRKWHNLAVQTIEFRENAMLVPGAKHHGRGMMYRAVHRWRVATSSRIATRKLEQLSVEHYRVSLLIRCLRTLRLMSLRAWQNAKLLDTAVSWERKVSLSKIWLTWTCAKTYVSNERTKLEKALQHRKTALIRCGWVILKENLQKSHKKQIQLAKIQSIFRTFLLRKVLRAWIMFHHKESVKRLQERYVERFRYFSRLHEGFSIWNKRLIRMRQQRMRWRLAMAHYGRIVIQRHLLAWNMYTQECNIVRHKVNSFQCSSGAAALIRGFRLWRDRFLKIQDSNEIVDSVRRLHEISYVQKIMSAWVVWTHRRMIDKRKEEIKYHSWTNSKEMGLICKYMKRWRHAYIKNMHLVSLERSAEAVYREKYQRNAWCLWHRYHKHIVWLRITEDAQLKFRRSHLLRYAFRVWSCLRSDWSRIYYSRHIHPIAFWGMVLLRKSFTAWRVEAEQQKSIAARLKDARDWHTRELVRFGLQSWLEVETQQIQESMGHVVLNFQPPWTDQQYSLARKYGRRWRINVLRIVRKLSYSQSHALYRRRFLESGDQYFGHQLLLLPSSPSSTPALLNPAVYASSVPEVGLEKPSEPGNARYDISGVSSIIKHRTRPKPREPDFLFDASTCSFVRTKPLKNVDLPLPKVVRPVHSLIKFTDLDTLVNPPCDFHEGPPNPEPSIPPPSPLTSSELKEIENTLSRYELEHSAYLQSVAHLEVLEMAMQRYLDGDQEAIYQPGLESGTILDLFDKIKHLKQTTLSFEKEVQTMQTTVSKLVKRIKDTAPCIHID
ncbi:hypothetical protein BASA83_008565 [Batrachochytrium salamandrivorans]|nr:hypothetical protein BASA83_008565 [Batrachochytrium salamandrivorans]